jgi:FemAB-related protein (PEP-CTERM system-associated)
VKIAAVQNGQTGWDDFVQSQPDACSYHRFGWKEVFGRSFGHPCHYLAAIDDSGQWHGILPLVHMRSRVFGNFLVSLPFVNYGGLLCRSQAAAALLLQEAERVRRSLGAAYVELRHVAARHGSLPTKTHKVTMVLALPQTDGDQWKAFDPKLRNQIRKAQKSEFQFRRGHLELLDDFYDVFARNMRDLGTPVYAKSFFRHVLEAFPESTAILAVTHEGRPIAAGIASWFKQQFEVPWASSIKAFKPLCPNYMLYWEAIRLAIERGFSRFDFGRSTPNEGTYNFKKQWGAVPIALNWQYLMDDGGRIPNLSPANPRYRMAVRAWQHLPVAITKVLGPRIVRNIP